MEDAQRGAGEQKYDSPSRVRDGLRQISWAGYRIVLAHCERYDCLRENFDNTDELWRSGVNLQVNTDTITSARRALTGRFRPVSRFVRQLLEEEMIAFVSTDAHRDSGRAPYMLDCWRALSRRCDPDYVRDLTRENALRLLQDEELK